MNKFHIVPACLPYTTEVLENFLKRWQGIASHIHIDYVGEHYTAGITPSLSWQQEIDILKQYHDDFAKIELHIMDINFSREHILAIREALPSVIIFSKEIHHNVCPELSHPFIMGEKSDECFDVLCMTIEHIGKQGEEFLQEHADELISFATTTKIENIHIDGGITLGVVKSMIEKIGACEIDSTHKHYYFTVGSYFSGEEYHQRYLELNNLFTAPMIY